jgi:hypothetical protein
MLTVDQTPFTLTIAPPAPNDTGRALALSPKPPQASPPRLLALAVHHPVAFGLGYSLTGAGLLLGAYPKAAMASSWLALTLASSFASTPSAVILATVAAVAGTTYNVVRDGALAKACRGTGERLLLNAVASDIERASLAKTRGRRG